jgi:hypothetical protein
LPNEGILWVRESERLKADWATAFGPRLSFFVPPHFFPTPSLCQPAAFPPPAIGRTRMFLAAGTGKLDRLSGEMAAKFFP